MWKYFLFIILIGAKTSYGQDSTKMKTLFYEGMNYENEGDYTDAIRTQKELFELDTNNYVSPTIIAGLYGKLGDFSSEILWANKAISINPNFSNALINLGNGYSGQGNLTKAAHYFQKAQKTDSLSPYPYYSLGVIEDIKQNFKDAIKYYQEAVTVDSTFENGYFNLAADYGNLKDFKRANENILKALKIDPDDKDAQEMHDHILEDLNK